jgi:mRNA interferase HigB
MHVISRRPLREFWHEHDDAEEPLRRWLRIAKRAEWSDFAALRRDFPGADRVGHLTVINVGGNKYRLILEIFFLDQVVLVRNVLTHQEYDEGTWRTQRPVAPRGGARHGDTGHETTESDEDGGTGRPGSGKKKRRRRGRSVSGIGPILPLARDPC